MHFTQQQLQSLLETLNATEPHYIRCIKPNNLLKPRIFENTNVLKQLQCGGVMEAIRISCAGYPTRKHFDEFVKRFGVLAPDALQGCPEERTACVKLLGQINLEDYQVGKTKVFLRAGQMAKLDACRAEVLGRSAIIIQSKVRSFFGHRKYAMLRLSAIQVQTICRGELARCLCKRMRREAASVKIQKNGRMYIARTSYKTSRASAVSIQTGMRCMAARNELKCRRQTEAAIVIQSHCRGYVAYIHLLRLMEAAIIIQCALRGQIARTELRRLQMAARETGALKAAKEKLEMEVEELNFSLQMEKNMMANVEQKNAKLQSALEETKEENSKLQSALEKIKEENAKLQTSLEETKGFLFQESQAARNVGQPNSNTEEFPVVDNDLIKKLTAENENLKALVKSLEKKVDDTERKSIESDGKLTQEHDAASKAVYLSSGTHEFPDGNNELNNKLAAENEHLKALVNSLEKKIVESNRLCEERLKQASEAETKVIDLKMAMQRLEEKLSDIETEDQILRQQALMSSTSRRLSGHSSFSNSQPSENGQDDANGTPRKKFGTEADKEFRKSQIERQQVESVDTLLKCVAEGDLGSSEGKPVAAYTVYKCLLHWKSFEAEKTSVFDRLIQVVGSAIEDQDNNDHMIYWLSNTSALLFLLQQSLRPPSAQKPPPPATSFFGRISRSFRSSAAGAAPDTIRQVDAKYPALLFKQQLTAYVEKIYGIVRENLKKDLSALLISCIQAPKTSEQSTADEQSTNNSAPAGSWQNIIDCLNKFLTMVKEKHVPPILVQKILTQVFQYINVKLLNSLLSNKEYCTFANGEFLKSGLDELEKWCSEATEEYAGSSWDELKHVRQAVGFLAKNEKTKLSYDDLANDLCPVLSVHQLYKICLLYADGCGSEQCVSTDLTTRLKLLMTDDAHDDSDSFMLDDNSSIPYSVDEISNSLQGSNSLKVKAPAKLLQMSNFQFLQD